MSVVSVYDHAKPNQASLGQQGKNPILALEGNPAEPEHGISAI